MMDHAGRKVLYQDPSLKGIIYHTVKFCDFYSFEMQQLAQVSQEAAKMVEGMNVGEISKPFTMINAKGKEICAIVKLKTRLNGHKATITEDYQRLKGIVMEKRSEEKLDKWIRDKQKHTYVRINEKWQKCDFKYPGWVKK
jgi:peptidyl-prolyl cis-trans isomerase SurA